MQYSRRTHKPSARAKFVLQSLYFVTQMLATRRILVIARAVGASDRGVRKR